LEADNNIIANSAKSIANPATDRRLPAMAGGKYNVGIIGYGLSAKTFHIPFIKAVPDLNLYAIVQRSPKPDDDASKDHPKIKLYHSADDLVKDDQVHVVIVTTAPDLHLQMAKAALLANKHGMGLVLVTMSCIDA
jgi:hypothetical protein